MKRLTERQRFERWAKQHDLQLEYNVGRRYYIWRVTQKAWEGWQAALRSIRARGAL